jgi:hypothetical protein
MANEDELQDSSMGQTFAGVYRIGLALPEPQAYLTLRLAEPEIHCETYKPFDQPYTEAVDFELRQVLSIVRVLPHNFTRSDPDHWYLCAPGDEIDFAMILRLALARTYKLPIENQMILQIDRAQGGRRSVVLAFEAAKEKIMILDPAYSPRPLKFGEFNEKGHTLVTIQRGNEWALLKRLH